MFPNEEEMALMLKKGLPEARYKDLFDLAHEIAKEAKEEPVQEAVRNLHQDIKSVVLHEMLKDKSAG